MWEGEKNCNRKAETKHRSQNQTYLNKRQLCVAEKWWLTLMLIYLLPSLFPVQPNISKKKTRRNYFKILSSYSRQEDKILFLFPFKTDFGKTFPPDFSILYWKTGTLQWINTVYDIVYFVHPKTIPWESWSMLAPADFGRPAGAGKVQRRRRYGGEVGVDHGGGGQNVGDHRERGLSLGKRQHFPVHII